MIAARVRRALALGLGVGLGLAACGSPSELPLAEPSTTLTVLLSDDWATASSVADAITAFEVEHDVRVEVREAKFSQLEEFMIADRAGSGDIDVSQWHAFAAGALDFAIPLTARFDAEYPDGMFVPGAIEDVTWGADVYGVPLDVNAVVMIVNLDLLTSLGFTLEDLDTWDQVRTVAEAAADQDVRFTFVPASTWSTYSWLRSNGGHWFEFGTDARPRMQFDAPQVRETFAWLADLVADDLAFAADDVDTASDEFPLFVDQQTLVLGSGSYDVARLDSAAVDFEWAVRPMSMGPSNEGPATVLGGSSMYIAEQADDPDLAWEFLTHLIQPEFALRYAKEEGRLPARTDVLRDPFFDDERYRTVVDQLPNASAMRLIAFPQVLDMATRSIYEVLNATAEADTTFRTLQDQAQGLLAPTEEANAP